MSNYVSLVIRDYVNGRICITADKVGRIISSTGSNGLWRKVLEWTGQKHQSENINIGVIKSINTGPIDYLDNFELVSYSQLDLQYITLNSLNFLNNFDMLYFIGLPEYVSDEAANAIETYVRLWGGVLIESPDRNNENINVIKAIDSVLCTSKQRATYGQSYWTIQGQSHYIYTDDVHVNFYSTMLSNSFSSDWTILMTDIVSPAPYINNYVFIGNCTSELSISYSSYFMNGIVILEEGESSSSSFSTESSSSLDSSSSSSGSSSSSMSVWSYSSSSSTFSSLILYSTSSLSSQSWSESSLEYSTSSLSSPSSASSSSLSLSSPSSASPSSPSSLSSLSSWGYSTSSSTLNIIRDWVTSYSTGATDNFTFYDDSYSVLNILSLPSSSNCAGKDFHEESYYFLNGITIKEYNYIGVLLNTFTNSGMTSANDIVVIDGYAFLLSGSTLQKILLSTGSVVASTGFSSLLVNAKGLISNTEDSFIYVLGEKDIDPSKSTIQRFDLSLTNSGIVYYSYTGAMIDGVYDRGTFYISRSDGKVYSYPPDGNIMPSGSPSLVGDISAWGNKYFGRTHEDYS